MVLSQGAPLRRHEDLRLYSTFGSNDLGAPILARTHAGPRLLVAGDLLHVGRIAAAGVQGAVGEVAAGCSPAAVADVIQCGGAVDLGDDQARPTGIRRGGGSDVNRPDAFGPQRMLPNSLSAGPAGQA